MRDLGVRISVDDFGVGYSSMAELIGLTIDELKIDKTFVTNLDTDYRLEAIVRATIELGRALNLSVVAEGVETLAALEILEGLGCATAQGFHISRPLTPEQLTNFLSIHASSAHAPMSRPLLAQHLELCEAPLPPGRTRSQAVFVSGHEQQVRASPVVGPPKRREPPCRPDATPLNPNRKRSGATALSHDEHNEHGAAAQTKPTYTTTRLLGCVPDQQTVSAGIAKRTGRNRTMHASLSK